MASVEVAAESAAVGEPDAPPAGENTLSTVSEQIPASNGSADAPENDESPDLSTAAALEADADRINVNPVPELGPHEAPTPTAGNHHKQHPAPPQQQVHLQQSVLPLPPPLAQRRARRRRAAPCRILDPPPGTVAAVGGGGVALPPNQYECTLVRRAIRRTKGTEECDGTPTADTGEAAEDPTAAEVGDVSLGMKLTVIAGRVVVQAVTSLADGRASPAQLAGAIQRGDVLLAIDGASLVDLPFDQLMRGLGPLSAPVGADGRYRRRLRLRFLVGEGAALLDRNDVLKEAARQAGEGASVANDMFGIFPMVDQLGGFHYGDNDTFSPAVAATGVKPTAPSTQQHRMPDEAKENRFTPSEDTADATAVLQLRKSRPPLDVIIAKDIAEDRHRERERVVSEFFADREDVPELLRPVPQVSIEPLQEESETDDVATSTTAAAHMGKLSQAHLMERGKRALLGAKAMSDVVESLDGVVDDIRSFKSWKTTLSLYSRASTRRKLVLDGASLPGNVRRLNEDENEDGPERDDGLESKSGQSVTHDIDADELLVQMAAHDDVWRNQVIQYFQKYIKDLENPPEDPLPATDDEHKLADMDTALSNELGNFLFGENMSRIFKKERKSTALPPEDVTLVLFDLTTKLSATIPTQITAAVSYESYHKSLTSLASGVRSTVGGHTFLATNFLLDHALPLWLQSFHPLPWEQRRLLWPLDKENNGSSTTASTLSDDLSSGSASVSQKSATFLSRKRKNLREQIEEQELNSETRTETCFLVTFYFTNRMLSKLNSAPSVDSALSSLSMIADLQDEIVEFIERYGSYLTLHTCLTCAISIRANHIIAGLLNLAKYDPRHKEVMKQLSKVSSIVFYEPTMLSALVQLLVQIRAHNMKDRRIPVIDLCVSAFPDIRPWQVREACGVGSEPTIPDPSQMEFEDLYYIYLSQLLHPAEGNEVARRDSALVEEWCSLSAHGVEHGSFKTRAFNRMANFLAVASKVSCDHHVYSRDLRFLLDLAMSIRLYDLALELAFEALQDPAYARNGDSVDAALVHTRTIRSSIINSGLTQPERLRKIILIYETISSHVGSDFQTSVELCQWFEQHSIKNGNLLEIIHFLAEAASPADLLEALRLWMARSNKVTTTEILPMLRLLLVRAAGQTKGSELSGSLLRLKKAQWTASSDEDSLPRESATEKRTIWQKLSDGDILNCK